MSPPQGQEVIGQGLVIAQVEEIKPPLVIDGASKPIQSFTLSLKGVTVELCSIGASIAKILLPKPSVSSSSSSGDDVSSTDDIVLGYPSPLELFQSGNPPYFGVIVGRVANRIHQGQFTVSDNSDNDSDTTTNTNKDYQVAINNDPNHLHGGMEGFSRCLWDMEIIDVPNNSNNNSNNQHKGVKCTLLSPDGDQGYPGTVLVTAIYTLVEATTTANIASSSSSSSNNNNGVTLQLDMKAELLQGDNNTKNQPPPSSSATPINLAQHTYFNLGHHDDPNGILDHTLHLNCTSYTPTDATSIPTRRVVDDVTKVDPAMDLTNGATLRDSLMRFAVAKAGLSEADARKHVNATSVVVRTGSSIAKAAAAVGPNGPITTTPAGQPYGFDHNYIVPPSSSSTTSPSSTNANLNLVGSVEHRASNRRMTVHTNASGVQVYTGNYLDGLTPDPSVCKDGAVYGQWQGLCLETQQYPDSILSPEEETKFPDFAKGKCHILRPGGPDYEHTVAYTFETIIDDTTTDDTTAAAATIQQQLPLVQLLDGETMTTGTDSNGRKYKSVGDMWQAKGIPSGSSKQKIQEVWYDKAAEWYEEHCPPTVNGVLGGFASISDVDLAGSKAFLKTLQEQQHQSSSSSLRFDWTKGAGCECGAGIGRVTKGLLLDLNVTQVDVVESSSRLICESPDYIGDVGASKCRFYCESLQDWTPPANRYSIIWIQWVLCYLTDDDIVAFLKRCAKGLLMDGDGIQGVIVMKENTCEGEAFTVDSEDASVCRSLPYWLKLIEAAGLRVLLQHVQDDFPNDIYAVPLLALVPI